MTDQDAMDCAQFSDVAAELALGVLTGRERAVALAHLEHCDVCREHVRQLAMTGEELLGLLPSREPRPGFETRVLTRLGLAVPVPAARPVSRLRPRGLGRRGLRDARPDDDSASPFGVKGRGAALTTRAGRAMAAAVITIAVAAAGLLGWGLRGATTTAAPPLRTAALLTSANRDVGKIFYYDGTTQWMYVDVAMDTAGSTLVTCQFQSANGDITTVGKFWLNDGYGAWGIPAPSGGTAPTTVRLVNPAGEVLASAALPA